ncbi:MAG: glycogen/starch/alpha-glucan phosphorylase [Elusimicrobia bacterium]|nr:glycogen/starch/alpha-glucan phosphorylase [Elusimicrobiota bacterium]
MPKPKPDSSPAPLPAGMQLRNSLSVDGIQRSFLENRVFSQAKDEYTATPHDNFMSAAFTIRDRMMERWITTQQRYHKQNLKRVYYLSMEFLIGRLLMHAVLNLDVEKPIREALRGFGLELEDLAEQEADAGLGNGGLGRLAACYMDSMATLGVPAVGYGIMFNYGIFQQKLVNGGQVEAPDNWLRLGTPWAIERPEYTIRVRFGGRTRSVRDQGGRLRTTWLETEDVLAIPYDVPVPGYRNDVVNTLRLWSARGTQDFDLEYFNHGDYLKAYDRKIASENISKVLYPNDKVSAGVELRLKQEYFFAAASLADIVRRFLTHNRDFKDFPHKVAIQLNDTHPAIAVAELMRILLDEEGLEWADAWDITTRTFAYTNHTLMPEALETWETSLLGRLLPRHLEIIYEINARFLREVADRHPGDLDRMRRMSLVDENGPKRIRMAYLCVLASHSVNGVSELHSRLLRQTLFKDFDDLFPGKFNNKTNGVAPRRWLLEANPRLSQLVTEAVGESWPTNLERLSGLLARQDDRAFQERWRRVKLDNKRDLARVIRAANGLAVDPESLFDVQVKRIHEYKRQLLFALFLIHRYLLIKANPNAEFLPRTAIIGGKAAPGYWMAKHIIKFINSAAAVINADRQVAGRLKVVFLEDYRVSLAQKVIPAAELSEQISTAGTEASGTGNMKFMMNGALTIGTLDGANIEIAEEAGEEHAFIFGLKADEAAALRAAGYRPREWLDRVPGLRETFALIESGHFSQVEPGLFKPILDNLLGEDPFLVLADFGEYLITQQEVERRYLDRRAWTRSSIVNVARSGRFSSDRSIRDYARDIWHVGAGREVRARP